MSGCQYDLRMASYIIIQTMLNDFIEQAVSGFPQTLKTLLAAPLTLLTTVSAGLFQDTARFCNCHDAAIYSLGLMLTLNALLLLVCCRERMRCRAFYGDFLVCTGSCVSFIVGIAYTLLGRSSILEEVLLKMAITCVLVKGVDLFKTMVSCQLQGDCPICLDGLGSEVVNLKCCHTLHEHCLWRWADTKKTCPLCSTAF